MLLVENSIGFVPLATARKFNHHVMKVIHEGGSVVEISTDSLSFSIIESGRRSGRRGEDELNWTRLENGLHRCTRDIAVLTFSFIPFR